MSLKADSLARQEYASEKLVLTPDPKGTSDLGRNPYLKSVYAPTTEEVTLTDLKIEGKIPSEISGSFYRNGANPQFPTNPHHWFDGDGMIHQIAIQSGRASYRNRYVRTQAWSMEKKWGKIFPGLYEVPKLKYGAGVAASAILLRSPLKDTSNTDLIYFRDQVISLWWLSGAPYALDPETLEPKGIAQFEGYTGHVSAHARIDPRTGELFFLDFSKVSLFPWVKVVAVDAQGKMKWLRKFRLPTSRVFHDVLFTENYVVLMDFPVGMKLGTAAGIGLDRRYASRIVLIPRDGKSPEIVFETEPCYVLHGLNAYEKNGAVILTVCKFDDPFRPKPGSKAAKRMEASGELKPMPESKVIPYVGPLRVETRPFLWILDLKKKDRKIQEQAFATENTEFPRINDEYLGVPSRYSYHPRVASERVVKFNGMIKYDWATGNQVVLNLPEGQIAEEFVFIPRASRKAEDDGWLATMILDLRAGTNGFAIFDAQALHQGPVARIEIPKRVPVGFHCKWVSR